MAMSLLVTHYRHNLIVVDGKSITNKYLLNPPGLIASRSGQFFRVNIAALERRSDHLHTLYVETQ